MAGEEKTEKATPKKRKDAREKEGNVLQSKEVGIAIAVLGIFSVLGLLAPFMYQMFLDIIRHWFSRVGAVKDFDATFFMENAVDMVQYCVMIIGPIAITAILLGVIPTIAQTKGLFTMKPLKPKFSRLSPLQGIKKLFSAQSIVGVIKGVIEITVIIVLMYNQVMDIMLNIQKLPQMDVMQGVVFTAKTVHSIIMTICILLVFVAAMDFVFQWWQFEKKLKMSKQEIKDEYKQIEGDPQIKSKIKQKQREIAQNRMLQEVPDSDVIVRNPTHFAVALKYNKDDVTSAPVVVAKGKDIMALKIIEIGEQNDVFIKEDRPLARLMYETLEIGAEIPPSLYTAIATILTDMFEQKGIRLSGEKPRSMYT